MDTDDKTILRRLKRGDAAALEAAVRQYSGYVTAVIGNQLGPCAAAEDIEELASDVFVALWRAAQPLRTEHLRGWLGKVARNQAISFLRRQHLQLVRDEDCILIDDRDAQKLLEAKERSALLNAALAALTTEDREIFLRRYYYNQTAGQIAEALHMNPSTVRSRLLRGRQSLRTELQKGDVQSLFEDYEENTVPLSRDADAERILEKTRVKLPGVKRKRPLGLVLVAAAAAVAVLCGAAAIVHYATVGDGTGSYIMPDTLRYDEENKKTILVDTPFEWNNPISFDTEGRTKGKVCGMRLGWLPEGWGTGYTQTAYDVIAQRDAEQAQSLPQAERELVVYTYDLFAVQDERKDYSVQCMSANTVAGCDFLCGGSRTEITKQGTIGPYDAAWVETHWQRSSPGSDAPEEWATQLLLLYDREKLCVVVISADWDDAERIAEHLEIVETSVDAPQPDLTNGRGFRWIGGVG